MIEGVEFVHGRGASLYQSLSTSYTASKPKNRTSPAPETVSCYRVRILSGFYPHSSRISCSVIYGRFWFLLRSSINIADPELTWLFSDWLKNFRFTASLRQMVAWSHGEKSKGIRAGGGEALCLFVEPHFDDLERVLIEQCHGKKLGFSKAGDGRAL